MTTELRSLWPAVALLVAFAGCEDNSPKTLRNYNSPQPDAFIPELPDAEPSPDALPPPDAEIPDFEVPEVACTGEDDQCPLLHSCIAGTCTPFIDGHYRVTGLAVTQPAGAANLLTAAFRATLNQGDLRLVLEADGYLGDGDFRWFLGYADEAPLIRDGCPTNEVLPGKYVFRHDQPIFPLDGPWLTSPLRPPPDAGVADPDADAGMPDTEEPDLLAPDCAPSGLRFVQRVPLDFTLTYPSGSPVQVDDPSPCAQEGDKVNASCYSRIVVEATFEVRPCLAPAPEGAEALLTPPGPNLRGVLSGVLAESEVRGLDIIVGGISNNLASLLASQGVLPTVDTNDDGASDAYPFEFEFLATPTVFVDDNEDRILSPVREADELCDLR
ncbi:MAG: hypothetical protein ACE366_24095 [Bradymonadia bacterium]